MLPTALPPGHATATPMNVQKRLNVMRPYLNSSSRVLDVGCASGGFVAALRSITPCAFGIEPLPARVAEFRAQHPEIADAVEVGNAEHLRFADGHFSLVLLNEVLEHVANETSVLRELHRVISPSGVLVVFSPNRFFPLETHGFKKAARQYEWLDLPFLPYLPSPAWKLLGLSPCARNYTPRKLRRLIASAGFTVEKTGFVSQTFENNSGLPLTNARMRSVLRATLSALESVRGIRSLVCVSQYIVARPTASGR